MSLPEIPLPLEVPFEIPVLIHPIVAHFGIVLPVVILMIELINLYYKRRALSVTSLIMMLLMGVVFVGLFFTGKTDGSEAFIYLSEAGQHELKEHKILGIYLIYLTVVLFAVKALAMAVQKSGTKVLLFVTILAFIGLNILQGKHGGELVYEYGANVVAANDAKDALEEKEEALEEKSAAIIALQEERDALKAEMAKTSEDQIQENLEEAKAVIEEQVDKAAEVIEEQIDKAMDSAKEALSEENIEKTKKMVEEKVDKAMEMIAPEKNETIEIDTPEANTTV